MSVTLSTTCATLAHAIRKEKEREVTYTWRSKNQSIEFDGNLVGGLVRLSISHDANRKEFSAYLGFIHWGTGNGYATETFTIFDRVNFPAVSFGAQKVARYSQKALDAYESQILGALRISAQNNPTIGNLWNRATEIAMGGDGTLRYSEVA